MYTDPNMLPAGSYRRKRRGAVAIVDTAGRRRQRQSAALPPLCMSQVLIGGGTRSG
jgi:hypothetical protein